MLTIYALTNAKDAAQYYEHDNYYAKDDPNNLPTEWWGRGAEKLGLIGFVEPKRFMELLEGKISSDIKLGRKRHDGGVKHKPGYDLTFSAPKSASMLAFIAGDNRVLKVHDDAVNVALTILQETASLMRVSKDKKSSVIKVNNFVVAKFPHDTSRGVTTENGEQIIDCNLHTHALILNMLFGPDGEWRSLSEKHIYDLLKLAGLVYRSQLAFGLNNIGYETEKTRDDGLFEVKGFTREQIEIFSNRTILIENVKKELGIDDYLAGKAITIKTRESKIQIDRVKLKERWEERAKEANIPVHEIYEASKIRGPSLDVNLSHEKLIDSVKFSIKHLSERMAVFEKNDILSTTLAHGMGTLTLNHATDAINELTKNGDIILVGVERYTTKENIQKEKEIVQMMLSGKNAIEAIATKDIIELYMDHLKNEGLTKDQQSAIKMLLTTEDRFSGIQGFAGTGKTTMLRHATNFIKEAGFEITGMAPTGDAARKLSEEIGIPCQTLSSLIYNVGQLKKSEGRPDIWILDEVSLASTDQISKVMRLAEQYNKLIFIVGDRIQQHAVEAGDPFGLLQDEGLRTVQVKQIIRQKDKDLKMAVKRTISGDVHAAFKKLGKNITEIEDKEKRLEHLITRYMSLSEDERNNTIVAVLTHAERKVINEKLRSSLITDTGYETTVRTLQNKSLTQAQKRYVQYYAVGDVVRFNRTYKSLNVKKNEYLDVVAINQDQETITLRKGQSLITWRPKGLGIIRQSAIEVFSPDEKQMKTGEFIRFTQGNRSKNIVNTETGHVVTLDKHYAKVKLASGNLIELNLKDASDQHWDYAWSSTMYGIQGQTVDNVLGILSSTNRYLTTYRSFYVLISRARNKAELIVDNAKKVASAIIERTGANENALPLLHQLEKKDNTEKSIMDLYQRLENKLYEADSRFARLEKIKNLYLESKTRERKKTVIILPQHVDRQIVNNLIRDGLKKEGVISEKNIMTSALERRYVTNSRQAKYYKVGDLIKFDFNIKKLDIKNNSYAEIIDIRQRSNTLTLNVNNKKINLPLKKYIKEHQKLQVYKHQNCELGVGDTIRWTMTQKKLNIKADKNAIIKSINNDLITLRLASGKELILNVNDYNGRHFEYTYTAGLNTKLPKSYHNIVANLDERTKSPDQQKHFFQILSNAKKQIYLLTHSKEFVIEKLNLSTGRNDSIHNIQDKLGMRDKIIAQLESYHKTSSILALEWIDYFKQKEEGKILDFDVKRFSELTTVQNELADSVLSSDLLSIHDIKLFNINPEKIKKHAQKHQSSKIVSEYTKTDSPLKKGELANIIISDIPRHLANIKSMNLDINEIQSIAYQHQKKLIVSNLSTGDKQKVAILDAYLKHVKTARDRWSAIFSSENKHITKIKNLKNVAYHATHMRNETGFQIFKHLGDYRRLFGKIIENNMNLIEKHAKQHEKYVEHQARRFTALKTKDWRHIIRFDKEDRSFNLTKKTSAYLSRKTYLDKEQVLQEIMKNPEPVLSSLLGKEPNKKLSKHNQIRWGNKGAIVLYTVGNKSGQIRDWESGIHGNIITYIAKKTGEDWYEVLSEFSDKLRIDPLNQLSNKIELSIKQLAFQNTAINKELKRQEKNRQLAAQLWSQGQSIKDTPAEIYLTKHRGIVGNINNLEFKYHPKAIDYQYDEKNRFTSMVRRPALLMAVKDLTNKVVSVQCIYLHPDSQNKDTTLEVPKRTIGSTLGYAAKVYSGGGSEVILAEGPETAASLINARPTANIYISLGNPINMGKYAYLGTIHKTNKIHIAADNDDADKFSKTWENVQSAAIELAKNGMEVTISKPSPSRLDKLLFFSDKKFDYNDILKIAGKDILADALKTTHVVQHGSLNDSPSFGDTAPEGLWEVKNIRNDTNLNEQLDEVIEKELKKDEFMEKNTKFELKKDGIDFEF